MDFMDKVSVRVNGAVANAYAPQLLQAPGADMAEFRHSRAVCGPFAARIYQELCPGMLRSA
jgi:hypothetical protein